MKRILAVISGAILGAVGVVAPAQAYPGCLSDAVCFYDGYNGKVFITDIDNAEPGHCHNLGSSGRNRINSIDNIGSGSNQLRVYTESTSCVGHSTTVYANTEGNMSGEWLNSIDSIWVYN